MPTAAMLFAACPTTPLTMAQRFAAAVVVVIPVQFAGKANGSSADIPIPKSAWMSDCNFDRSGSPCNGVPANTAWMTGYLNVTWGATSDRIQFWTGGNMNDTISAIQVSTSAGTSVSCDGFGVFYNKVEITNAAPMSSYLISIASNPDLIASSLTAYTVHVIFNGASSLAPSVVVLAALALAALFANKQ